MLDRDLAGLYGVKTKALNQAVKRNIEQFPDDFMFQLNKTEAAEWMSQNVTSNDRVLRSQIVTLKQGEHLKYLPYAFTEQGVVMLSSILKSKTAIQMNIRIMRAFISLRRMISTNELIRQKIEELEEKTDKHDKQIQAIFEAIKGFLEKPDTEPKKEIGFHIQLEKKH